VIPAEEMVMILGCGDGRVSRTLRRDWVTRLGGDMTKPFVNEKDGIPPSGRCVSETITVPGGTEIRTDCEEEKVNRPVIVALLSFGPCTTYIVLHKGITLDKASFSSLDVALNRLILVKDSR
jgi:hypothetical protein